VFATVQLGTHLRAKAKRDDMSNLLRKMRCVRLTTTPSSMFCERVSRERAFGTARVA